MRILPLAILAGMTLLGLGISMEKHGKEKTGKENAGVTLLAMLVQWGLILWAVL